jgi:hypothetical protein
MAIRVGRVTALNAREPMMRLPASFPADLFTWMIPSATKSVRSAKETMGSRAWRTSESLCVSRVSDSRLRRDCQG